MIWISVKLYLIKEESAMKNQLKKIIHCVLITLILQSQVLSVQAAQVKFDGNKKFSAAWRNNAYTVAYDPNGGSGSMSSQQFKYDISGNLKQNTFQRDGYEFLGWSLAVNADTPDYTDQEMVKNLATEDGAELVLHAVWKDIEAPELELRQTNPTQSKLVYVDNIWARFLHMKYTYSFKDNEGVTGYYWGKNIPANVNDVNWIPVTGDSVTITRGYEADGVGGYTSGTYYFVVRDKAGNIAVMDNTVYFGNASMASQNGILSNEQKAAKVAMLNSSSAPYIEMYTSKGTILPDGIAATYDVNGADVSYTLSSTRSDCYISYVFFE